MILASEGKTYAVHFQHRRDMTLVLHKGGEEVQLTGLRGIVCSVHEGKCTTHKRPCETPSMVTANTTCSPRDNYNIVAGRKEAFRRAIAHFPRAVRAGLWESYKAEVHYVTGKRKSVKLVLPVFADEDFSEVDRILGAEGGEYNQAT